MAIRCDNGPELICQALADECAGRVGLSFIDPRCPWQNPYVESFHGRLRDECLNLNHFAMLLEAKVVINDWRAEYNTGTGTAPWATSPRPDTRHTAPTNTNSKKPSSQSPWTNRRGPVRRIPRAVRPRREKSLVADDRGWTGGPYPLVAARVGVPG